MPKPYLITLRVEEIALGATLRKLHEMPGVMSVDMNLGDKGGTGPGREQLQEAAAIRSGTVNERIARFLAEKGPTHRHVIQTTLGITPGSLNSALSVMKSDGILERIAPSVYGLAGGVSLPPLALPAPNLKSAPTASGAPRKRAVRGAGVSLLLTRLASERTATLSRSAVGIFLKEAGVPSSSVTNMLARAESEKLVKRVNDLVHLTDRGRKQAAHSNSQMNGTAHHG